MQLGFTLFEKMHFDEQGSCATPRSPNTRFRAAGPPKEMLNEAVTAEQRTGPYGAKGVGETGTFGVSPAIANAIHDAVGVRLTASAERASDLGEVK